MTAPHSLQHRHLHQHGSSRIHQFTPQAKLAGLFAFVIVVALTPREAVVALLLDACVLAIVVATARLRPGLVLGRLAAILPFITFAFFLPFVGDGEQVDVGPVALSVDGLWASWNIIAKATMGATASIIVTATTPIPDLLAGLTRLRVPNAIVGIIGFMFRYLDLIVDELARMRRAMVARGHDPRWLWQARPIASSAGALFVRTYERGERVHDAMAARGFTGAMPEIEPQTSARSEFLLALMPALLAALILGGVTLV
jgi:cobalt/nickel transport system permease protein